MASTSFSEQKRDERRARDYRAGFDAATELLETGQDSRVALDDRGHVIWVADAEDLLDIRRKLEELYEFLPAATEAEALERVRTVLAEVLGRLL